MRRFGIEPKVALLSHSNFGTEDTASARKMREVLAILQTWAPKLEVEGEMHADAALSPFIREEIFPNSRLKGAANLLVMPGLDAANIAFNLLKVVVRGCGARADPARRRQAGAHRDAVDHRARPAQHERDRRDRPCQVRRRRESIASQPCSVAASLSKRAAVIKPMASITNAASWIVVVGPSAAMPAA